MDKNHLQLLCTIWIDIYMPNPEKIMLISLYILNIKAKHCYTAVQSHKAVSAYFTSKQILPFRFAEQYRLDFVDIYTVLKCDNRIEVGDDSNINLAINW